MLHSCSANKEFPLMFIERADLILRRILSPYFSCAQSSLLSECVVKDVNSKENVPCYHVPSKWVGEKATAYSL